VTNETSDRLVRLPLWISMTEGDIERVITACQEALDQIG
jgi:dTDP-4-amino-4,6-dideoxygalactose transaminase